jgi:hypothetical protein
MDWNSLTPEAQAAWMEAQAKSSKPSLAHVPTEDTRTVKRSDKKKQKAVTINAPGVKEFTLNVDQEAMTLGDYLDMTEGLMSQRLKVLGSFVHIDGKHLTPDEGYQFMRSIPMAALESITTGIESALSGEDPN